MTEPKRGYDVAEMERLGIKIAEGIRSDIALRKWCVESAIEVLVECAKNPRVTLEGRPGPSVEVHVYPDGKSLTDLASAAHAFVTAGLPGDKASPSSADNGPETVQ